MPVEVSGSKNWGYLQAMALVAELAHCVQLSRACAAHFVQTRGPSLLIGFMRGCNRSTPHLSMFRCVHICCEYACLTVCLLVHAPVKLSLTVHGKPS